MGRSIQIMLLAEVKQNLLRHLHDATLYHSAL
jgi:hypothetical protein